MPPPPDLALIARLRLVSQRLVGGACERPVDVARWMLATQAQDLPGAKWSLGLRTASCRDADVVEALCSGEIVRSWPLRGTLHLMAAEDLGWVLALTAPRIVKGSVKQREELGLDAATLDRARVRVIELLDGGRELCREDLLAGLTQAGVTMEGPRAYHTLSYLAHTGTLCFGPPRGKTQTFVLLGEWVRRPRELACRDEALGELGRRYFTSHGPATLRDFTGWTKLLAVDVKTAMAVAAPHLSELRVAGTSHWLAPDLQDRAAALGPELAASVLALPGFDELLLGYTDRQAALAPEHIQRIVPGNNGMFMPTIVHGGQVVGTWRREVKAKETLVSAQAFEGLTAAAERGFKRAALEYGRFVGATVRVAEIG